LHPLRVRIQHQALAKLWHVEELAEPADLIGGCKEGMFSIDASMLPFDEVVEFLSPIWSNRGNLPEVFTGKLSALGINIALLYKGASLARAPTGIRLIDEATPVIHVIVQIMPCAGKQLPKVAG